MSEPIKDCPQPETPIREKAWTDEQKVEAMRKDAARYRWLIAHAEVIECNAWHWWNHDSDVTPITERIDAAMQGESHD